MLGRIEGRRRGEQRIRWLDGIIDSMDMGLGGLWKLVMNRAISKLEVRLLLKAKERKASY